MVVVLPGGVHGAGVPAPDIAVSVGEEEPVAAPAKAGRLSEPSPAPEPELAPAPKPAEAETPKASPASTRPATRRDTLALEESLLEQARRSIGAPTQALSLLREHERRFPNGELTAERLYLTAQTQARAGNGTAARHYARLLTERFPKSTYVRPVRPLLDAASAPPPSTSAR